ncbi:hypothetical protein [Parenemella sanctibonifatiensis]|uniref:hypothetical protein n=1 Tax=Parenemella sanctibonifatiensis TaxID=2016505 RepID=UPI001E4DAD06|nr:hypothetical protein [Parenemella sanctibonifatiensis]
MQIKTRQRVRDLAEVYTHAREVTAMLDLVPDMFPSDDDPDNTDRKFLEPAAGSGNFLEEILRRKLAYVTTNRYPSSVTYEHRILRALASIYAIDIDPDNVDESKERMRNVLQSHLDNDLNTTVSSQGFASAVDAILETNILLANTLTDLDSIEWVDYNAGPNGTFTRQWSTVDDDGDQLDLFTEPKADLMPLHYSQLADHPDPVLAPAREAIA